MERGKTIGGSVYLIFIGLAVAAMGLLFMALLYKSYAGAKETRSWPKVEVTILESAVGERQFSKETAKEYSLKLLYGYQWEGEALFGTHLKRRDNPWYKEQKKILPYLKKYSVGSRVEAFVNPQLPKNPAEEREIVLEHETKAGGYSIWFPGLFVVGGFGIVIKALMQIFSSRSKIRAHP